MKKIVWKELKFSSRTLYTETENRGLSQGAAELHDKTHMLINVNEIEYFANSERLLSDEMRDDTIDKNAFFLFLVDN